jgi:hypothetical protein
MDVTEQFIEGADRSLDHLNIHNVRALLNSLIESPFFYHHDDPDLFGYLRSNQEDIEQFFTHYFGWELYVDRQVARVIKPQQHNTALRPSQRDLFDLTRRDECTAFMLLVEFYEKLMRDLNVSYDDDRNIRFLLADFVQYSIDRCVEEMGEEHSMDRAILDASRVLFPKLIKYRFIEQVEKEDAARDEKLPGGMREHVMYEFLPGIHCYRPDILTFKEVIKLYTDSKPATEAGQEDESEDDTPEQPNAEPENQ